MQVLLAEKRVQLQVDRVHPDGRPALEAVGFGLQPQNSDSSRCEERGTMLTLDGEAEGGTVAEHARWVLVYVRQEFLQRMCDLFGARAV